MTQTDRPTTRKRLLFRALRMAITLALLYWVLSRAGVGQVLDTLREAEPLTFGLALALFQLGVVVRAARWWVLLRGSGVEASPGVLLGLQYIAQFFNVSLPTGFAGDVVRTFEFKGSDSRAASAGVVVLDRTLGFSSMFAIALVALAAGRSLLAPATSLWLALMAFAGLVGVAIVLQGDLLRRLTRYLPQGISLEGEGRLARLYRALTGCSPSGLRLAFVISTLNSVLIIIIHYLIGRSVGVRLGAGVFFIITPIVSLSLLVPTIGGLGLREAGYQLLLAPLGVPGRVAVALGFGVYLARLSAALLGGLYHLVWSSRQPAVS